MSEPLDTNALEERARRGYDVFVTEGEDRWLEEFTTPDFVWDVEPLGLGHYEGRDTYRRFYEDWVSSYDTWSLEVEELEVVGEGMTVAALLQQGTPRNSDQMVEFRWGQLNLWDGDRISRVINFQTLDEARTRASELGGS
jgi:SnoaL-like protein